MKKPGSSQRDPYRDDPDAVSLHTTPDDAQYTDDAADLTDTSSQLPPSYDEVAHYTDPAEGQFGAGDGLHGLGDRDRHFAGYSSSRHIFQKKSKVHISGEHVALQHPPADSDAEYLQEWVEYMSRQAPTPYIVVCGTHSEQQRGNDGKKKQVDVTDFRICVNLRNYLWPNFRINDPSMMKLRTVENGVEAWRGTVFKRRAPGVRGDIEGSEPKPTLLEWCHRYCASSAKTRMFRLTRTVAGLDQEYLHNRLSGIIRGTNYKGHLEIAFPVADRTVDIYSQSRLNNWRLTTWICWLFYLTFLWILAWPYLYLKTKRYNVVRAEWAFSRTDSFNTRKFTTVSEEQWIEKFGPAVKQLALDGYEGVVGDDMLNQVLARPETHQPRSATFRASHAALGSVAGLVTGGPSAINQASNLLRFVAGSNDEVGWGYDT